MSAELCAAALDAHKPVIEFRGEYDSAEPFLACSCGWDGLGPRGGWPKSRPDWEEHFAAALAALAALSTSEPSGWSVRQQATHATMTDDPNDAWELVRMVLAAPSTPEPRGLREAARAVVDTEDQFVQTYSSADGKAADAAMDRLRAVVRATPSTEPALDAVEIRATHRYGFRSGEWAVVEGIRWANGRACYRVRFPDARRDSWVVNDPSDPYEFRLAQSHTGYVEIVAKADHPDDPEVMGDAESQP